MADNFFPVSKSEYEILVHFSQPLTATQLSGKLNIPADQVNYLLTKLARQKLLYCLNLKASKSRLFWLTTAGMQQQSKLWKQNNLPVLEHDFPDIDWSLYGNVCFSHRSAVIKTLVQPMQPAHIKRRAVFQNPGLRMSANNVRDVIRFLLENEVVQPVRLRKKAHLHYQLTEQGMHFQRLLLQSEVRQ